MRYCPRSPHPLALGFLLLLAASLALSSCALLPREAPEPAAPPPPPVAAPPEVPPPPPAPPVPEPPLVALEPVPVEELPVFEDDLDFEGLAQAIQRSIDYYLRCGRTFDIGGRRLSGAEMADGLRHFLALAQRHPTPADLNEAIRRDFEVYASTANGQAEGGVLFTGYYEPVIEASRTRSDKYCWPLYRRPADLLTVDLGLFRQTLAGEQIVARLDGNRLVPYYSREEITTQQRLEGRGLEILWAADPIDVFFLQIQGSGVIRLEDGTTTRVHYAGTNGRAFRSIGRLLVDEGRLPRQGLSMQVLRRYLSEHPEEMERILNHNESYVFFEEVDEGPLGNIWVALTPGRSIATDYRLFPGGALAWVKARKPIVAGGKIIRWKEFGRFVLNQDTGGVITGPGRVDFFWGTGPEAALAAGGMREQGQLYFLVKRRLLPEPASLAKE